MGGLQRGLLDYRGTFVIDSTGDGTAVGARTDLPSGVSPHRAERGRGPHGVLYFSNARASTVSALGIVRHVGGWRGRLERGISGLVAGWQCVGVRERGAGLQVSDVTSGLSTVLAAGLYPTWNADGSAVSFVARDVRLGSAYDSSWRLRELAAWRVSAGGSAAMVSGRALCQLSREACHVELVFRDELSACRLSCVRRAEIHG